MPLQPFLPQFILHSFKMIYTNVVEISSTFACSTKLAFISKGGFDVVVEVLAS